MVRHVIPALADRLSAAMRSAVNNSSAAAAAALLAIHQRTRPGVHPPAQRCSRLISTLGVLDRRRRVRLERHRGVTRERERFVVVVVVWVVKRR